MIIIPFEDLPSFTEEITLSGVTYILDFNWNSRGNFWSLSVYDRDQIPIVTGIRLIAYYELIKQYVDKGLPSGEMYVIDPSENMLEVEQNDFQSRSFLVYFEDGELVSI